MISIAAVLDSIICSHSGAVAASSDFEAPETPWYDQPIADPKCDLCLQVSVSMVTLIDVDGSSFPFGFQAGSTISDVLQAHARLTGPLTVQLVSDDRGAFPSVQPSGLSRDKPFLFSWSKSGEGEHFSNRAPESESDRDAAPPSVGDVDMGPGRPDGILSPLPVPNVAAAGESGLLPRMPDETLQADLPSDVKSGALPTSVISPTAVWTQQCQPEGDSEFSASEQGKLPSLWDSVQALLGLTQQQFLRLSVPCIGDSAKLLSLRSQVVTINERIQLLDVQQGLWADDEIAFHLKQLVEQFCSLPKVADTGKAKVCVIDPLLLGAWICGCGFPIEDWAKCHVGVLQSSIQVIGVGRLDTHWIPFQLVPCGVHANIFTWDAPCHGHERFQPGFGTYWKSVRLRFSIDQPSAETGSGFHQMWGAMAIHFLHGALHGTMLPIVASEVDVVHTMLRERFHNALTQRGVAHRPWIWGSGDADDDLEGECGPLPRLPTSVEQPEPVRSTIESFTREIRTEPESVVLFSPVESAVSEADPSMCLGTQSLPAAVPIASDELSLFQLLAADCQMLKDFETPIIEDLTRLGWLRSQLISVSDRLAILSRQYGIWADDEIRFHLHELAAVVCSNWND